jgi:integrase
VPRIKITAKAIDRLRAPDPSGRQALYWDSELRGFGVLVSGKTKSKTFIVQRDLPGGLTRRVTIAATTVLAIDKARERARAVLADLYKGIDPKAARRGAATLRQVLADYLEARKSLREGSRLQYADYVERYLTAWLDRPVREITADMVEARHRAIAKEIAAGERNRTGAATANLVMRILRLLWNFAADRIPDLPPNPVRRLGRQRAWFVVRRRKRHVSAERLPSFYAAVQALPNPVERDYLLLLLFTGLRRREAAKLTWDRIDMRERVIRLVEDDTKADRLLNLPMSDAVFGIFLERQRLGREASGFVFPGRKFGTYLSDPKYACRRIEKTTGIVVSAHDLRRTFITVAESTDMSPIALKALVNHSLGSDVTSGYVIISTERLREAAQRVTNKLLALTAAPVLPESVGKLA